MQQFLQDIQELLPKVTQRKSYVILCAIKWRVEHYGNFGLGKRDGPKYGISERQMSNLIKILTDYGYIKTTKLVRGSRGFMCKVYKASKVMKEILQSLKQGLNGACKSVGNLTDRIRQWNDSHNAFEYLKDRGVVKYTKLIIDERFIVQKQGKKYNNCVYDSHTNRALSLFGYLRGDKKVWEMCKILKLI